jgi:hypothetical protein
VDYILFSSSKTDHIIGMLAESPGTGTIREAIPHLLTWKLENMHTQHTEFKKKVLHNKPSGWCLRNRKQASHQL